MMMHAHEMALFIITIEPPCCIIFPALITNSHLNML